MEIAWLLMLQAHHPLEKKVSLMLLVVGRLSDKSGIGE
jgi:hypothetical protein